MNEMRVSLYPDRSHRYDAESPMFSFELGFRYKFEHRIDGISQGTRRPSFRLPYIQKNIKSRPKKADQKKAEQR